MAVRIAKKDATPQTATGSNAARLERARKEFSARKVEREHTTSKTLGINTGSIAGP